MNNLKVIYKMLAWLGLMFMVIALLWIMILGFMHWDNPRTKFQVFLDAKWAVLLGLCGAGWTIGFQYLADVTKRYKKQHDRRTTETRNPTLEH